MSGWPGHLSWAQDVSSIDGGRPLYAVIGKVTKKNILLNSILTFLPVSPTGVTMLT